MKDEEGGLSAVRVLCGLRTYGQWEASSLGGGAKKYINLFMYVCP